MKTIVMMLLSVATTGLFAGDTVPEDAIQTAKDFIMVVDQNDAERLTQLLHPDMMQFSKLGDKLMPSTGRDFVKMVADKKLGGTPRTISVKSAQIIRGDTVDVTLQAVSEKYDFMYQISLAKDADKWVIVTVLSDIKPSKQ